MVYLVIEDKVYNTGSIVQQMIDLYPDTSLVNISGNGRQFTDALYKLQLHPIFTEEYLVVIGPRVTLENIETLISINSKHRFVIYTPNARKLEYSNELAKYKPKVVDNFNLSKEKLYSYITKNLQISDKVANGLIRKCGSYLPYVWEAVSVLKGVDGEIQKEHLDMYVDNKHSIMPRDVYLNIIGFKGINHKSLLKYLYDFKFAFSYLKKSMIEYGDNLLTMYSLMMVGEVSANNYKKYNYSDDIKLTDYQKKLIVLEIFPSISIDVIIKTNIMLKGLKRINDLINIFKGD